MLEARELELMVLVDPVELLDLRIDLIPLLVVILHVVRQGLRHLVAVHGSTALELAGRDFGDDLSFPDPVNLLEGPVLPRDVPVVLGCEARADQGQGQGGCQYGSDAHEDDSFSLFVSEHPRHMLNPRGWAEAPLLERLYERRKAKREDPRADLTGSISGEVEPDHADLDAPDPDGLEQALELIGSDQGVGLPGKLRSVPHGLSRGSIGHRIQLDLEAIELNGRSVGSSGVPHLQMQGSLAEWDAPLCLPVQHIDPQDTRQRAVDDLEEGEVLTDGDQGAAMGTRGRCGLQAGSQSKQTAKDHDNW
jgi:hypothetical protein